MRRFYPAALLWLAAAPAAAQERAIVDASEPSALSVTIYRDPDRGEDDPLDRRRPGGFAVISETRQVALPPGQSRIRFEGVAEGMVAISAIVTGLPGGTIEKNRNADLLSPAALVDGTLGNRVTITRTNPATGTAESEPATVRTRADGGLVLETAQGFEAVRCSGLPEKLTFDSVPEGLSARPVYSVDTRDDAGGTYTVTLTYIAWGFDWQAHYVATLDDPLARPGGGARRSRQEDRPVNTRLLSWLTVLNDNGQSFPDASLQVVAGRLNIDTDFEDEADPPIARPLRLQCYPIGDTARGSPVPDYGNAPPPPPMVAPPPPPPPPPVMGLTDEQIIVTGARRAALMESPIAVTAVEEQLGDLKLYRVPVPVTVAAKGLKQVAFLNAPEVKANFLYEVDCRPAREREDEAEYFENADLLFTFENKREKGLGRALPQGGLTLFEPGPRGTLLVGEDSLRDYAGGQEVELELARSTMVFGDCGALREPDDEQDGKWVRMVAQARNASPNAVAIRFDLGWASDWDVRGLRGAEVKDGKRIWTATIPGNATRRFRFRTRYSLAED